MRPALSFAVTILVLPTAAGAQTAAPTSGLQGTAPRTEVQQSANGTLDVVGGTNLNLQGENFRGTFGASRQQTPALPAPSARPSTGSAFASPLGAPDFNPSLPSGNASPVEPVDPAAYRNLILPRFRSNLRGSLGPSGSQPTTTDGWRYRFFQGRWWYWQPSESWLYWDGAGWQAFAGRQ